MALTRSIGLIWIIAALGSACEPDSLEEFVTDAVDRARQERSSSLPPYPDPSEQDNLSEVEVTRETYERLRAADLPMLYFLTCSECSQEVVYDAQISLATARRFALYSRYAASVARWSTS